MIMKKLMLLMVLCFTITITNLQAGEFILGGSFSQVAEKFNQDYEIVKSKLSARAGYIFYDRVAVGIAYDYGIAYAGYYNDKDRMSEDNYIGMFFRFHETITGDLKYYIEPYLGFNTRMNMNGGNEYGESQIADNGWQINYGVNYGIQYFLTENIALDMNVGGFNFNEMKSSVIIDLTSLRIGVKFYLPSSRSYRRMF